MSFLVAFFTGLLTGLLIGLISGIIITAFCGVGLIRKALKTDNKKDEQLK